METFCVCAFVHTLLYKFSFSFYILWPYISAIVLNQLCYHAVKECIKVFTKMSHFCPGPVCVESKSLERNVNVVEERAVDKMHIDVFVLIVRMVYYEMMYNSVF